MLAKIVDEFGGRGSMMFETRARAKTFFEKIPKDYLMFGNRPTTITQLTAAAMSTGRLILVFFIYFFKSQSLGFGISNNIVKWSIKNFPTFLKWNSAGHSSVLVGNYKTFTFWFGRRGAVRKWLFKWDCMCTHVADFSAADDGWMKCGSLSWNPIQSWRDPSHASQRRAPGHVVLSNPSRRPRCSKALGINRIKPVWAS